MPSISIDISQDKYEEFKVGFLRENSKPDGLSDAEWILQNIKGYLINNYKLGKQLLAEDTSQIDDDVLD